MEEEEVRGEGWRRWEGIRTWRTRVWRDKEGIEWWRVNQNHPSWLLPNHLKWPKQMVWPPPISQWALFDHCGQFGHLVRRNNNKEGGRQNKSLTVAKVAKEQRERWQWTGIWVFICNFLDDVTIHDLFILNEQPILESLYSMTPQVLHKISIFSIWRKTLTFP